MGSDLSNKTGQVIISAEQREPDLNFLDRSSLFFFLSFVLIEAFLTFLRSIGIQNRLRLQ